MPVRRYRWLLVAFFVAATLGSACSDEDPQSGSKGAGGGTNTRKIPDAGDLEPVAAGALPKFDGPWFVDEAGARGLTQINQTGEPKRKQFILSAVGPGAAVFDANGDGRMDIYAPNGSWLVGPNRDRFYAQEDRPRNALYIQQADGTFRNEAKERGVDDDAWGFGSCAADLDNDGDADLLVSNLGPNRLYINDGKGHFQDIAKEAGVAGSADRGTWAWSTGIACGDLDRDGRLDIYVASYADMFEWMRTNTGIKRGAKGEIVSAAICDWQGLKVYCGPLGLPGQHDCLYRNAGGTGASLRFTDMSASSGIRNVKPLYGFQVLMTDLNRDGWVDIYVANDSVESYFFENQKDGTFKELASDYNIAFDHNGDNMAGMGADSEDLNGDGWPEIHKTNFSHQTNNLYLAEPRDDGTVTFRDFAMRTGVHHEVYHDLAWGVVVFDFDNDGRRDLYYANGHVYPEVDAGTPRARGLQTSFAQFNKLLRNVSVGRLRFERFVDPGSGIDIRRCSRGASLIDVDNDGDLEVFVTNMNETPNLLVNRHGTRAGHWLRLRLEGDPLKKCNRDGIGCKVIVRAGTLVQHIEVKRGQGWLGCHDPRLHVGLGAFSGEVTLEVTWTGGDVSKHTVPANTFQTIRQSP